jgi:regulator of protease activity HflC (stomatin/prohibitin superfamily)
VTTWFGSVQQSFREEGVSFVNPMARTAELSVQRRTIDFSDRKDMGSSENPVNGPSVGVITHDQNSFKVDISLPYALQPGMAWKLYQKIGQSDRAIEAKLMETNARSAITETFASKDWVEATTTGRDLTAKAIGHAFSARVAQDLTTYGFSVQEASGAIVYGEPQIREIGLSPKLVNSIDERLATAQQVERQKDLTNIAALEAERRANEGAGVQKLFDKLPKASAQDIATILNALATKQQADALTKAVESGKVQVFPIPVGGNLALPAQAQGHHEQPAAH